MWIIKICLDQDLMNRIRSPTKNYNDWSLGHSTPEGKISSKSLYEKHRKLSVYDLSTNSGELWKTIRECSMNAHQQKPLIYSQISQLIIMLRNALQNRTRVCQVQPLFLAWRQCQCTASYQPHVAHRQTERNSKKHNLKYLSQHHPRVCLPAGFRETECSQVFTTR